MNHLPPFTDVSPAERHDTDPAFHVLVEVLHLMGLTPDPQPGQAANLLAHLESVGLEVRSFRWEERRPVRPPPVYPGWAR
jgi:hypothetical protein